MELQQAAGRVQVGAARGHEERRHHWRSDPEFQNRFRLAMLQLVLVALLPALVLSRLVTYSLQHPALLLDSPWVLLGILVMVVSATALILRRCDKVSSR